MPWERLPSNLPTRILLRPARFAELFEKDRSPRKISWWGCSMPRGTSLREARTSETGSFRFEDLTPGIYFLTCGRPVAATKGQAKAEVKADQTAEVTISLFR